MNCLGHQKGAFTGADEARQGLFEVADGGTMFLDEIGELPKSMQAKLLRVLESGEIRRVGANDSFRIDVRIVCATHRDLSAMVSEGDFREDLMYRINTFEIQLPPLRDRIQDVEELAIHLMNRFRPETVGQNNLFDHTALESLRAHVWPGNIRELANVVEHTSIICDELPVTSEDLPRNFGNRKLDWRANWLRLECLFVRSRALQSRRLLTVTKVIKAPLLEELGISLKTLYNKINQGLVQKPRGLG